MTIASEINRLQIAKSCLKSSIESKWVSVPSDLTLDGYYACVDAIQTWPKILKFLVVWWGWGWWAWSMRTNYGYWWGWWWWGWWEIKTCDSFSTYCKTFSITVWAGWNWATSCEWAWWWGGNSSIGWVATARWWWGGKGSGSCAKPWDWWNSWEWNLWSVHDWWTCVWIGCNCWWGWWGWWVSWLYKSTTYKCRIWWHWTCIDWYWYSSWGNGWNWACWCSLPDWDSSCNYWAWGWAGNSVAAWNWVNYWAWWGWGWANPWWWRKTCWWNWKSGVVDICYKPWEWVNSATWWNSCFSCCWYCVHRFTSNWTFTITW